MDEFAKTYTYYHHEFARSRLIRDPDREDYEHQGSSREVLCDCSSLRLFLSSTFFLFFTCSVPLVCVSGQLHALRLIITSWLLFIVSSHPPLPHMVLFLLLLEFGLFVICFSGRTVATSMIARWERSMFTHFHSNSMRSLNPIPRKNLKKRLSMSLVHGEWNLHNSVEISGNSTRLKDCP